MLQAVAHRAHCYSMRHAGWSLVEGSHRHRKFRLTTPIMQGSLIDADRTMMAAIFTWACGLIV
jgi:hypothetical protein